MKHYFISDCHLFSQDEPKARLFIKFLKEKILADPRQTSLYLLGDIFDLWISDHSYFIKRYQKVIDAFEEVAAAGVPVHYFAGNHDLFLEKYWQSLPLVRVYSRGQYMELGKFTVYMDHGDMANPEDRGYRFLKKVLQNPVTEFVAHNLPGPLVAQIGDWASQKSRHYTGTHLRWSEQEILSFLYDYGRIKFAEKPFDIIITGHVHIEDDHEVFDSHSASQKPLFRSINLGSWFQSPKTFIIAEDRATWQSIHP